MKTGVLPDSPLSTWESEAGGSQVLTMFTPYPTLLHTHAHRARGKKEKKRQGERRARENRRKEEKRGKGKRKRQGEDKGAPPTVNRTEHLLPSCLIAYHTER